MRKPLARALELGLYGGLTEAVTPYAGSALLVDLARRSGVVAAAEHALAAKGSPKGLAPAQVVESFVLLSALGGDCVEDFDTLRRDQGLAALLGYELPAASTARQWLDRFHEAALVAARPERPQQKSFIPQESPALAGLQRVVDHSVRTYGAAVPAPPTVTLDVDAHLVACTKREARVTYAGFKGYHPLLVCWAETGLVLADEFRDGNVPAGSHLRELVDHAVSALPTRQEGWRVQVRADSAAYQQPVLDHWQRQGWRFAVSADMGAHLRAAIQALPETAWQFWAEERGGVVREVAEVEFVPGRPGEKRDAEPFRYVAIRVRAAQGTLFGDGSEVRHYAVVTNDWETAPAALVEWQRGKAGTIEHVHHVLKNELAADVYPSGKFGANAAWLRLQVLTHNLLELLKATALEPTYRQARPKRLRFAIFIQLGRVVQHARQQVLRVSTRVLDGLLRPGQRRLQTCTWAAP
jgi:hypothetical protein